MNKHEFSGAETAPSHFLAGATQRATSLRRTTLHFVGGGAIKGGGDMLDIGGDLAISGSEHGPLTELHSSCTHWNKLCCQLSPTVLTPRLERGNECCNCFIRWVLILSRTGNRISPTSDAQCTGSDVLIFRLAERHWHLDFPKTSLTEVEINHSWSNLVLH